MLFISVGLLGLAVSGKILAVAADIKSLYLLDPIFLIQRRVLFVGIIIIEAAAIIWLLCTRSNRVRGLILTWLSINFILYHLTLYLGGFSSACPCLGYVGSMVGVSTSVVDLITKLIIVFFMGTAAWLMHGDRILHYMGTLKTGHSLE